MKSEIDKIKELLQQHDKEIEDACAEDDFDKADQIQQDVDRLTCELEQLEAMIGSAPLVASGATEPEPQNDEEEQKVEPITEPEVEE